MNLLVRTSAVCVALLALASVTARAESLLSPDDRTALVSHKQGQLQLWDLVAGRVVRSFTGHTGSVTALAFSRDGKTILSGGEDGTVRLWDVTTGKELWGVNYGGDRKYPTYLQYGDDVQYVAFMPDGKEVLAAQHDGTIKLLDSQSGKDVRAFRTERELLWAASLSADGKTLVSTSALRDGWTIHLWDTATGEELKKFRDTDAAVHASLLPDGKRLLSGGHQSLRLWDASTGKLLQTLPNPILINVVAPSPDGRVVLVGAAYRGGGVITKWDVAALKVSGRLAGHRDEVSEISFSADSATALSAGDDGALILWDVSKGTILYKLKVGRTETR
ncbi:MAG TPA: WD40 repeat domain-containing protein [Pyrinomonadaceae bacterium]|nr:WD40 repeat domain-containing protein [Pyrinomonadaceae bacterium]